MSNKLVELITRQTLSVVANVVKDELAHHGLWGRIRRADVIWCAVPQWPLAMLGFFIHRAHPLAQVVGYVPGHIYIPAMSLFQRRLSNVLRHEYAHALAHYYPAIKRSADFRAAFGGFYGQDAIRAALRSDCVSRYAMTEPMEDFAETFMLFLKRGGKAPKRMSKRLFRKWDYVAHLPEVTRARAVGRAQ